VPTRPEDVTADWLTTFLAPRNPGVQIDDIAVLDTSQGAATRLRVRPQYAPGRDAGLPPVLFVKTSLTRRMLVADPHMYVTEVRFYEHLRPGLTCETPQVYAWALDEETNRFAVVIEDLSLRSATFPSALSGLTADAVEPLMRTIARLHAPNWGRRDLESSYPWLETATTGKAATFWRDTAREAFEIELDDGYKSEALDLEHHPLDLIVAALPALQVANSEHPLTVLHGDTHIGNCYQLPDRTGGLLDWQLMRVANWANDVAYTIMTALDVEQRRSGERSLLQSYLDELSSLGVDAPAWDEAWERYRQQMPYGIACWMVTPTAMYSEALLDALIRRCVVAADDLDSYAALGVQRSRSRRITAGRRAPASGSTARG
jgi:aminoglycoside phosphotransferase (APT) family kinase protein